jgi:hypothetical protein
MGGSTKTTKNTFDPAMQAIVTGNVTDAKDLTNSIQPYGGPVSAPTSPLMNDYFGQVGQIQGAGTGLLESATGAVQGALGYHPQTVTAPMGTAASAGQAASYDPSQALGMLGNPATAGGVDRSAVRDVNLGSFGADQIRALYNPFENDKVKAALGDYERARQMQRGSDGDAAIAAGAFGGSRHGVSEALTNESFQRQSDAAANDLRYQGWNSAMQGALGARGQDLSAAQGNQSADLGVAGMNNQTGMFNAGQRNSMGQFGAGLLANAGQFNAGQANNMAQTNAGFQQQSGIANQNAALQSLLANQSAGLQGNQQQLTGAGLLGDLSNSQVNQRLGLTGALGTAGGVQQGLSQADLDRLSQLYQQNINNKFTGQGLVNGATGQIPGITNSTQTTTTPMNLGGILGAAGTIGMGLATGGLGFGAAGLGGLGGLGGLAGLAAPASSALSPSQFASYFQ